VRKFNAMEKFTIEIETSAGWVMLHTIMRPGEERALTILKELREKYPQSNLRVVKWMGTPIKA
jgi:hypothetical protein